MDSDIKYINESPNYIPEKNLGNNEYKYTLIGLNNSTIEKKTMQMKMRLDEGNGEAIYDIGILDDGTPLGITEDDMITNIKIIEMMSAKLGANVQILNKYKSEVKINDKLLNIYIHCNRLHSYIGLKDSYNIIPENRFVCRLLIRRQHHNREYIGLRIACIGNVDAGKSTTMGCLVSGKLDNCKEKARNIMFNHEHERESGRTSSVCQQIMGFDKIGNPVYIEKKPFIDPWTEVYTNSDKIIQFYDLAGHKKYYNTTIRALNGSFPDYCMMIVGANMGINLLTYDVKADKHTSIRQSMACEHIILAMAKKIPLIFVLTKIDITPEHILNYSIKSINSFLKKCDKQLCIKHIHSIDDIHSLNNTYDNTYNIGNKVPLFTISNTTGEGHDILKKFLNVLPQRINYTNECEKPLKATIQYKYPKVAGVGLVLSIVVLEGILNINDKVWIGPNNSGKYIVGEIKSIQDKCTNVRSLFAGQNGTIAFHSKSKITNEQIRVGMMLIDYKLQPISVYTFDAKIKIIGSINSGVKVGYECIMYTSNIKLSIKILSIENEDSLLNDGISTIKFKFKINPEFIEINDIFIMRESFIRGYGKIININ